MERWIRDVRYASRLLLKSRGFTAVAVLTLAAGICANTAIFSLVHAVLLRQLPYRDPGELVWIWSNRTDRDKSPFTLPDYMDYRDQNKTLQQVSAFCAWSANLLNAGEPERVFGVRSSANIFQTLGVKAEAGRTLLSEDDNPGSQRAVVLSHGFWKRRFGMSADIIGKPLTLNEDTYIVVGVLPPDFAFPGMEADMVVPLAPDSDPLRTERASVSFLFFVGRFKKGVTLQQAETNLNAIAGELQRLYPVANAAKKGVKLVPLQEELVGNFRPAFLVLTAAVGLVLLIACLNLANLVLARGSTRNREMAVRLAMGASRSHLIRQLLTENILLAVLGGFLGILLTPPAIRSIIALSPSSLPRVGEIKMDAVALVFGFLISLFSGVLFGWMPALRIAGQEFSEELRGSGKGVSDGSRNSALRNLLILIEVAMSLLLLIGAGLLARSFVRLESVSPGFEIKNLLVMRLSLPKARYSDPGMVNLFYDQLSARIRNLPGVRSAGATSVLPLSGSNVRVNFVITGRPPVTLAERPLTQYRMIGPNYFRTMSIPMQSGRDFSQNDTRHSQAVAIISSVFARRHWQDESPVGAHLQIDDNNSAPRDVEIVGVVGDVRHSGLHEEPAPEMYVPISQIPEENVPLLINNMNWVIRTSAEPLAAAGSVRREIQSVDPSVAAGATKSMEQLLSSSLAPRRFNLFLLGISAATALILASMGIYGLISYSVAQRTREIGVRMALGAQQLDVVKLVVGSGLKIVLTGVASGLLGATLLTRLLSSLLYSISATDVRTFVSMPLLLIFIAVSASYIPARRAARVDPVIALRAE